MGRPSLEPEAIPAELRAVPQWVNWKWIRRAGESKPTKPPFHPSDVYASHSTPSTWSPFHDVVRALKRRESPFAGIGFVFSDADPFAGVDLDGCIDPETGEIAPWALELVRRLNSYTEISPSGTGLKVFIRASLTGGGKKRTGLGPDGRGAVEVYDRLRFFTVTGRRLPEAPLAIAERAAALDEMCRELFPEAKPAPARTESPPRLALDDEELLQRARRAENGGRFDGLWNGDRCAYAGDDSRADLALCSMLAFWTGGDAVRIDRLFRRSGLMRPKWDERRGASTYGERTVARAVAGTTEFYRPGTCGKERKVSEREPCWEAPDLEAAVELGEPVPPPDEDEGGDGGKASQATVLVRVARETGLLLFHTPDEECYATVPVDGHEETWRLQSRGFANWLRARYLRRERKVPGGQAVQDAVSTLCGLALLEGPELPVYTRIGERAGAIYLNLGDAEHRAVRITAEGWQVVAQTPVRFWRSRSMVALPAPERGGRIEELRELINVSDEEWPLIVGWLLGALRPRGPYPVLELHGEQGSAKTTTGKALRALVDPSVSPLRCEPKEVRDIAIAAKNNWVIGFDNLSNLHPWLSDALCRLSTGGGLGTRELYSNDEETLFDAQRPVILNGIGGIANRSDLLDRALLLNLPSIPEGRRKTEEEFWEAFDAARPRILGALLDGVVAALRYRASVRLPRLPRMADFALWVTAAERGLDWPEGTFITAYEENRGEANSIALEASPIGELVLKLIRGQVSGTWEGTSQELLEALRELAGEKLKDRRDWPKNARAMAVALRRIAPNLRAEGIEREDLPRIGERRPLRLFVRGDANGDANARKGDANDGRGDANGLFTRADRAWGDANDGSDANSPLLSSAGVDGRTVPAGTSHAYSPPPLEEVGEFASFAVLRHEDDAESRERLVMIRRVLDLARRRDWVRLELDRGHVGPGEAPWRYWCGAATLERLWEAEGLLQAQPC